MKAGRISWVCGVCLGHVTVMQTESWMVTLPLASTRQLY